MTDERREPDSVLAAAAGERRDVPATATEAADLADKYDQMLRLADLFDDAGAEMREWSKLGREIIIDPDVVDSSPLSPTTWTTAEDELRAATTGKDGLLSRSIELDADALILRATVLTYRWIDELQAAAYQTLGSLAGRAIGYLAPEINLGGAIVAAGLIETDSLDRDGVAAYLNELAAANPELMEHVTTGGGMIDNLQMRGMLTAGVLAGDAGRAARVGGLRAAGIPALTDDWGAALRDVAMGLSITDVADEAAAAGSVDPGLAPSGLADLMAVLTDETTTDPVRLLTVGPGRLIAFLTGGDQPAPQPAGAGRLRLVAGDQAGAAADVIGAIGAALASDPDHPGDPDDTGEPRVMLVGLGAAGATALEVAVRADLPGFAVDQVITGDAPSAQVPRLPSDVQVLSLEDRSDPVALLGSLINADTPNRLTVVYDGTADPSLPALVAGGRAADRADHPALVAALDRWREQGYLRAPA